jgi:hypothetical protein
MLMYQHRETGEEVGWGLEVWGESGEKQLEIVGEL